MFGNLTGEKAVNTTLTFIGRSRAAVSGDLTLPAVAKSLCLVIACDLFSLDVLLFTSMYSIDMKLIQIDPSNSSNVTLVTSLMFIEEAFLRRVILIWN